MGLDFSTEETPSNTTISTTKTPKGTDKTFTEKDLLKTTDRKVEWTNNPPQITVEKIPVPGGYLLHNVLTSEECDQLIDISEELGYLPSPLRHLDSVIHSYSIHQTSLAVIIIIVVVITPYLWIRSTLPPSPFPTRRRMSEPV
eukprot:TRINITY_DN644_c0_g1_i2.p1 TRINITY_DN644_c0_g1~~TRINITY_DN644_c0_g1_i2.p1  ORF type:complete len:143 (-),score=21.43 TRINITY_DN644_c0_g1_i2:770-1198(-)